ncbi:BZ3500_MvSof-1268-A1-R1_Chr3-1g06112 [Microbotryum saponariae]|uniref:BZ3500_MvSof-1268-A1-R1_Chr3-1g06112 protein n=1 Tax=Microbotryum saponariae TaxID=289078 RepID=A0A2X0LKM5_9BASI|nr:BZ3500_MvSof-1268-A1-R1_Chr3-1g06112 [Microbotryum saponariae]SDA03975.1 BZ3501_MvSof-1269-A2-R1_Chr3-2g05797 [Microbotryum saponariae]
MCPTCSKNRSKVLENAFRAFAGARRPIESGLRRAAVRVASAGVARGSRHQEGLPCFTGGLATSLSDFRFPELELFVSAVAVMRLVEVLPAVSRGPGTLRRAAIFARHVRTC